MTVEKHTYHRIYELFSVNEPIADWIAMTDFDTPYPLMLTLMEAKEDEEREAPLEAVIWAAAEIAAAAKVLFQHPNTVRYRLSKIQRIIGMEDDPLFAPMLSLTVSLSRILAEGQV